MPKIQNRKTKTTIQKFPVASRQGRAGAKLLRRLDSITKKLFECDRHSAIENRPANLKLPPEIPSQIAQLSKTSEAANFYSHPMPDHVDENYFCRSILI